VLEIAVVLLSSHAKKVETTKPPANLMTRGLAQAIK